LWQNDSEAFLIDPCTGQERPALQWLNTTIRDSNPIVDIPTDVKDIEPATSPLRIYPTVFNGELTIEGLPREAGSIQIFDINGRLVRSVAHRAGSSQLTINVAPLPAGLYIVRAGNTARKVIKQ
jgi:hypothetical protein